MTWSFLPQAITKITLLSYVTSTRAMVAYAFAAMLLSIWAIAELSRSGGLSRVYSIIVTLAVGVTYLLTYEFTDFKGSFRMRYYLIIILIFMILNYLLLRAHKKTFSLLMACVIIGSGVTVNPVNIGAGAILDAPLSKEIQAVNKTDGNAVWMANDSPNDAAAAISILIYANGAHATGGINNYPDMAKWSLIDPRHTFESIYNRSAHVAFTLTKSKTNFVLTSVATFTVYINVNDIKKLNIKYIVSRQNLTQFDNAKVTFNALYARDGKGYTIYQAVYNK
jgi:hypothetical protein